MAATAWPATRSVTPYDGSGGGGAGGVVSLRFVNGLTCGSATANGGVGGNNGTNGGYQWSPGGGGGGGKVYLQGSSVACAATSNAGARGTNGGNAYGASAGSARAPRLRLPLVWQLRRRRWLRRSTGRTSPQPLRLSAARRPPTPRSTSTSTGAQWYDHRKRSGRLVVRFPGALAGVAHRLCAPGAVRLVGSQHIDQHLHGRRHRSDRRDQRAGQRLLHERHHSADDLQRHRDKPEHPPSAVSTSVAGPLAPRAPAWPR